MGVTTFPQFSILPTELHIIIWQHAATQATPSHLRPGEIIVLRDRMRKQPDRYPNSWASLLSPEAPWFESLKGLGNAKSMLGTCVLSRRIALEAFKVVVMMAPMGVGDEWLWKLESVHGIGEMRGELRGEIEELIGRLGDGEDCTA